jgi:tetratricopeptide (TPR) repeat protein
VLGAAVSTIALFAAAGADRRSLGLATSPYGWNRVIVVHTMSTLVLSWWFARTLGQVIPELRERWMTLVWAGVGGLVTLLTVVAGIAADPLLESLQAGYAGRLIVRILWCMALQVPWFMLALSARQGTSRPPAFSTGNLLAFAVFTAVGVPLSFLAVFFDQQTGYARTHWEKFELLDAMLLVQRLYDAGSNVPLGGRRLGNESSAVVEVTPQTALRELRDNLTFLQQQIQQLEAAPPSRERTLQLAEFYLSVDRPDDAMAALKTLAPADPFAAVSLANLCHEEGLDEESQRWAETALQLAGQTEPTDQKQATRYEDIQMQAYKTLALLAGEQTDFARAEQYMLEALERLPSRRAEIHDRLGKHYEFIGELGKASKHQREASRLAPEQFPEPASLAWKMLSSGAPVGLARPKSSRYKH